MDVVAENFDVGVAKVSVEEASSGLKACGTSIPTPATASSIQAAFFLSSESAAVSTPSPIQLESQSLASHISEPPVTASPTVAEVRVAEMSISVEPSTTASNTIFPSSAMVTSAPSCLPNDTAGLVLPPSSLSVLGVSAATGIPFKASSIASSPVGIPTYSTSLTSPSFATSTPYSCSDMIHAPSTFQSGDERSESLGCSPPGDTPHPDVPSTAVGLYSSVQLLTVPTTLSTVEGTHPCPLEMSSSHVPTTSSTVEGTHPCPLEMSSSQAARITTEGSLFPSVDLSKHQRYTVLSSTFAPTDNSVILQTSTSSRSECQPDAPSHSIEGPAAFLVPSKASLEMTASSVALPLPDVRETDPVAPSRLPVGASTGLLTEHERSSLKTSTSFPSGISTITFLSPSLILGLPETSPSHSIIKFPNPLCVSSSSLSPVRPIVGSALPTDPAFAYSISTSCLALLSSVEKASSRSLLAGPLIPPSSSSSLGQSSTRSAIPHATRTVSSSPLQEPISDIELSRNLISSTTVAPSLVSLSCSAPLVSTLLTSSDARDPSSSSLSAGSDDKMDCPPSPSSHFTSLSSNSASNTIQISRSSLELGSIKEEPKSKSGPSIVPTSETLPRRPARGGQKGEGWPYAPQGWPEPDDKWLWRIGKRVHVNGYFRDRFLGLPKGLCKGRKTTEFSSKKSIVEYLKENFPDVSVENFFKSFQWRIPYVNYWNSYSASGLKTNSLKRLRPAEEGTNALGFHKRCKKECKAGNSNCGLATGRSILLGDHVSLPCDICCTEPGFCRECKCILCCKTIAPDVGESNFVRCIRKPLGNGVCGHAAHLECALNSKMAGVVKKRGLDMEYLCRRCDNRTDLRELVTLLLEAVGNTDVREHAEKSLKLALEVMKGTERGGSGARVLESLVQTALRKVQSGVDIQEAFKELKDQGAAAEAARRGGLSLMEDVAQQPEASLDQWLPSSGSPSSHPSPGTPSSFTSPRLRSNPSVTSGQLNGTPTVDGSLRKHGAADGHIDHVGQPQSSHEVVSNSKYKNLHLGNKSLIRNAGQERGTQRICAVSSNFNNNGLEAICDSFTMAPENHVADPGSRDGKSSLLATHNSNSGIKNLKDQKSPSVAGKLREDILPSEMCKSCGAVKRHTRNALEITSNLKSPKIEDGANRVLATSREEEPDDLNPYKQIGGGDTGVATGDRPRRSADGSAHKVGTSLQLLDLQCEHDMQAALQKLRRAQEAEFERAKACLTAKKESILRKYELVEASRREFSEHPVSSSLEVFDELLLRTGTQFAGAIEERDNFNTMLTIGEGFGSVSRDDLKKFYRWPPAK